jgi:hypothetical protein
MPEAGKWNHQDNLNRLTPGTAHVKLGDLLADIIAKHNALAAKLDADAGVTDTNYSALHAITTLDQR